MRTILTDVFQNLGISSMSMNSVDWYRPNDMVDNDITLTEMKQCLHDQKGEKSKDFFRRKLCLHQ